MKIRKLIENTLNYEYFDALKANLELGIEGSDGKVFVVTGENATGKSFFAKLLDAYSRNNGVEEVMRIGMGKRTESGIVKALMFGDEKDQSTGETSAR